MGRRRAEETGAAGKPGVIGQRGVRLRWLAAFLLCLNDSEATAGPIHTPCLVMVDQPVKNLLRRQAFVSVNRVVLQKTGAFYQ